MEILPFYLKEIASNCTRKNNSIAFHLKCHCGNEVFEAMKAKTNYNKVEEEKWNNYWKKYKLPIFSFSDAIEKKTGKNFIYGSTLFGIRVGKYYYDVTNCKKDFCIIKARCVQCGKEYTVFDSRKHGYDAVAEQFDRKEINRSSSDDAGKTEPKFHKLCREDKFAVKIKIENDLTEEDFAEDFGNNASEENYANAFTRIVIYSVIDGKAKPRFDEETA